VSHREFDDPVSIRSKEPGVGAVVSEDLRIFVPDRVPVLPNDESDDYDDILSKQQRRPKDVHN
jgi:hypothetical protein